MKYTLYRTKHGGYMLRRKRGWLVDSEWLGAHGIWWGKFKKAHLDHAIATNVTELRLWIIDALPKCVDDANTKLKSFSKLEEVLECLNDY